MCGAILNFAGPFPRAEVDVCLPPLRAASVSSALTERQSLVGTVCSFIRYISVHFGENCANCLLPLQHIRSSTSLTLVFLPDFCCYICSSVSVISSLLQEMSRRVSLYILIKAAKAVKASEVRLGSLLMISPPGE